MSKIDTLIKLAGKFKSDLRQQYKDSMSYPDAAEIADLKRRGGDSPRVSMNNAFNYIEKSKNPEQARNRGEAMFGEFLASFFHNNSHIKYKGLLITYLKKILIIL